MYSAMQSKILVLGTCYCYVGPTASHAEEWVQYRVLVPGPRSSVPGPRSSVPGPRSSVPGPWSPVPGPRSPGPLFRPSLVIQVCDIDNCRAFHVVSSTYASRLCGQVAFQQYNRPIRIRDKDTLESIIG